MISFKNVYYSVSKEIKRKRQETNIAHCEFEPDKMKEGLGFVFYVVWHVQRENLSLEASICWLYTVCIILLLILVLSCWNLDFKFQPWNLIREDWVSIKVGASKMGLLYVIYIIFFLAIIWRPMSFFSWYLDLIAKKGSLLDLM